MIAGSREALNKFRNMKYLGQPFHFDKKHVDDPVKKDRKPEWRFLTQLSEFKKISSSSRDLQYWEEKKYKKCKLICTVIQLLKIINYFCS